MAAIKASVYVQFLNSLNGTGNIALQQPLRFELTATPETIAYLIWCADKDAPLIRRQVELHFPGFVITDDVAEEDMPFEWLDRGPAEAALTFKANSPVNGRVSKHGDFALDPYNQLFGVLEQFRNENFALQIHAAPLPETSFDSVAAYIRKFYAPRADELAKLQPAWLVNVKIYGCSVDLLEQVAARFVAQYNSETQRLAPVKIEKPDYYEGVTLYSNSSWLEPAFLVSAPELAALMRFSVSPLVADRQQTVSMKTKLPPQQYRSGKTVIGISKTRPSGSGGEELVSLPEEVRDRHVYAVGKSGTGKTTLIESIARQDIEQGYGVAVIDPHGDMIRHLLEQMPEDRLKDCVYFSPKESPVSLKILAAGSEHEIDLLSDDLLTMFRRTSESWGDKMQAILQMAFQTLLRVPGTSFTDITRLLTDKAYRARLLAKIDHPQLISFWENRYDARQA